MKRGDVAEKLRDAARMMLVPNHKPHEYGSARYRHLSRTLKAYEAAPDVSVEEVGALISKIRHGSESAWEEDLDLAREVLALIGGEK